MPIGKLLSGAVKLYLRSQVQKVEALEVKIAGKNREILQGHIPHVFLSCDRAVYQGLHLSQIELNGTNIAVNLPEIVKKQPLKLIEPILVEIQLRLNADDLQASLESDLLQSGLRDLWKTILAAQDCDRLAGSDVEWQNIAIANNKLNLTGNYQDALGKSHQLTLSTEINLSNEHTLCLSSLKIASESLPNDEASQLEIDLGTDVDIRTLTIKPEQIVCEGNIRINS